MADVNVTNTKITALNDFKLLTENPATESTANTAQKFVFTPTGKDNHALIIVSTAADDATDEKLNVTIAGGDGPFALGDLSATVPGVAGLYAFQIETGRYLKAGKVEMSFKVSNATKALKTDTSLKVYVCEMLPN